MSLRKKRRKSPYEHGVKGHTRKGRPVHKYRRGEGEKTEEEIREEERRKKRGHVIVGGGTQGLNVASSLHMSQPKSFRFFNVKVMYPDGRKEAFKSDKDTFEEATDDGLMQRPGVEAVDRVRITGVK